MGNTQTQLIQHIERLRDLVRSAHLKRSLAAIDADPNLNFWRIIYGNLLDISVLEWCKIFGTNSEPTHWKNIVPEDDHDSFRQDLLKNIGVDHEAWGSYRGELKTYRDTRIAHHIEELSPQNYPQLDLALQSSYFYYDYLIKRLRSLGNQSFPDDLHIYCDDFTAQATTIAEIAIQATRGIKEKAR